MTQTQEHNVPTLRFPGFEGEWEETRLGNHTVKVGSGVTPKGGASVYQDSGIPLLRSQNVRDSLLDLSDVAYINEQMHGGMSGSHIQDGDVLLNITGASIGRSCVVPEGTSPANVNQHVCIIRLDCKTSSEFIQTILASPKGEKLVFQSQAGGGREGLNFENVRKFKIHLPTLPEQRKIAGFLGAVDEKIAQLTRKRALLEAYKKGCMQQLFNQKIRFKDEDGNDFPDWEEKRLGELVKVSTGSSNREDSGNVGEYAFFDRSNDQRWSPKYLFDCEAIIVAGEGKDFPPRYFKGKFDLHQRAYAITKFEKAAARFLYYWIDWHRYHFLKYSVGSTMPSLRMAAFNKFPVSLPHPDEQRKIADFLSALDHKIDLVGAELEHAETFKKGLLQQMFI